MAMKAINGDLAAAREIFDRVEGKPAQKIATTTEESNETYLTDDQLLAIKSQLENQGVDLNDYSY